MYEVAFSSSVAGAHVGAVAHPLTMTKLSPALRSLFANVKGLNNPWRGFAAAGSLPVKKVVAGVGERLGSRGFAVRVILARAGDVGVCAC
jgi:hypothetical protein